VIAHVVEDLNVTSNTVNRDMHERRSAHACVADLLAWIFASDSC